METKLNRLCLFVFGWDKWNIVPPKFEYGMLISFTVLPSIINQYKFRIKTRCKIQLERLNMFSIPSRKLFDAGYFKANRERTDCSRSIPRIIEINFTFYIVITVMKTLVTFNVWESSLCALRNDISMLK